jgi:uncharacterized membrane protein YkvA (DUF1232 family)
MFETFKRWAKALKRDVVDLWLAARDRRTPWLPKLVAAFVAAYELSPIDLIPDFVPILGYVDDLVIVPIGIAIALRLIPAPLITEFRAQAGGRSSRPSSVMAAYVIVGIWLIAAAATSYWVLRHVE